MHREERTFGQDVIDSLTEFLDAADRGEPITARMVKLNLEPRSYGKKDVGRLRAELGVSQAVFAQLIGVSTPLVQAWEQGRKKPSKLACRLLHEINRSPREWMRRQVNEAAPTKHLRPRRKAV